MPAGATLETWSLDAERPLGVLPLIVRGSPGQRASGSLSLSTDAAGLRAAAVPKLAVPTVWHLLTVEDALGEPS